MLDASVFGICFKMGNKSLCTAYLLLVFGGMAGLHLLYLGRDNQAFAYWCTFGGYFGLALFRDVFRLPAYTKEANLDPDYMTNVASVVHANKSPPFSVARFVAKILIGNSWCYLWIVAIPNDEFFEGEVSLHVLKYLGPLAAALGVWLIGNIGREKVDFKWCSIGAYLVLPFILIKFDVINWCSITSAIVTEFRGKHWRRTVSSRKSLFKRIVSLLCGWMLFCSLFVSYIYFNAEIEYKDGGKVKVRDSIHNFLKSPMFIEFKKNMYKLYEDAKELGWMQAWINLIELLDPLGELHALKVLNLKKGASQEDISSRYKSLTKEWHPDRHKTEEAKKIAQEKFIEIADAYEKLSSIKKRRSQKSKL